MTSMREKTHRLISFLENNTYSFRFDEDIYTWFHWDLVSQEKFLKVKPFFLPLDKGTYSDGDIGRFENFLRIPLFQAFDILYSKILLGEIPLFPEERFSLSLYLSSKNKKGNEPLLWWHSFEGRVEIIIRDEHRIWEKGHLVLVQEQENTVYSQE